MNISAAIAQQSSPIFKSIFRLQFYPASGTDWPSALPFPRILPSVPQHSLFWKSCKESQDLYGVLANKGRFFWMLFPFIKSLPGFWKEMFPILLNLACLLKLLKIQKPKTNQKKVWLGYIPKISSLYLDTSSALQEMLAVVVFCWLAPLLLTAPGRNTLLHSMR